MVLKRAREDIKVVLSGEGADEMFGGYHRYHLLNHDQKIFELRAMEKYHYLINKYYGSPESRYANLINRNDNQFDEEGRRYLLDVTGHYFGKAETVIHGMGLTDFYTSMQVLLTMADRMSMAFGIENRSPFLDHRVMQYAFSMPEKYKIKDGTTKYIIKKIAEKFIPREIVERIDKRGFVAPLNMWFGWGKGGKYSRSEYRQSVYDDWKRIFFAKKGRKGRTDH
jgi:asparagine synthase (glutamine-hydrolysing)